MERINEPEYNTKEQVSHRSENSLESVSLRGHRAVHFALRPGLLQLNLTLARLVREPRDLVLPLLRRAAHAVSACDESRDPCYCSSNSKYTTGKKCARATQLYGYSIINARHERQANRA